MTVALFPGQGVRVAGLGAWLREVAPDVAEEASDALGVDIAEACEGASGSTRWAQPAIVAVSVAGAARLGPFDGVAGHSVGEYSALVACGAMPLRDALRVVAVRAEAMQRCADAVPGGMAAVLGDARIPDGVTMAADNAPGHVVVAGPVDELGRAIASVKADGGRAIRLEVAGAFHSPAMAAARSELREALASAAIGAPAVAFWSSTRAARLHTPDGIRSSLLDQLTSAVLWRQTVLACGASRFVDVGPGRVVGALARRIVPHAEVIDGHAAPVG